jgi:hypothetical protein
MRVLLATVVLFLVPAAAAAQAGKKVDIVSVTGCLREQAGGQWHLVAATEPAASTANAPQKSEIPAAPPAGTQRYRLIGVSEFALPTHKDKTVVVKGLLIKDATETRLNMTSIVDAVAQCSAAAPK